MGDPDVYDHISSDYSRLDFDSPDEFMHFFSSEFTQYLFNCINLFISIYLVKYASGLS